MTTFYHRATAGRGRRILASGFRDSVILDARTSARHVGVWLAECCLGADPYMSLGDAADGSILIAVSIPIARVRPFEVSGRRGPHRLFVVPADLVNRYPRRRVTAEEEARLLEHADWRMRGVPKSVVQEFERTRSAASRRPQR